jgi:hypothetical protein
MHGSGVTIIAGEIPRMSETSETLLTFSDKAVIAICTLLKIRFRVYTKSVQVCNAAAVDMHHEGGRDDGALLLITGPRSIQGTAGMSSTCRHMMPMIEARVLQRPIWGWCPRRATAGASRGRRFQKGTCASSNRLNIHAQIDG